MIAPYPRERCAAGLAPVWLDADGAPVSPIEGHYPVRCLKVTTHAGPHESYMYEWPDEGPLPRLVGALRAPRDLRVRAAGFVRAPLAAGLARPLWPPDNTRNAARATPPPFARDLGPRPHAGCDLCARLPYVDDDNLGHPCYACPRCRASGGAGP